MNDFSFCVFLFSLSFRSCWKQTIGFETDRIEGEAPKSSIKRHTGDILLLAGQMLSIRSMYHTTSISKWQRNVEETKLERFLKRHFKGHYLSAECFSISFQGSSCSHIQIKLPQISCHH